MAIRLQMVIGTCAMMLLLLAGGSTASACGSCGSGYDAAPWSYGPALNRCIYEDIPTPPYYALHPPVYYGQQLWRPYGVSPFALPSALSHRYVAVVQQAADSAPAVSPQRIVNPYVEQEASDEPAADPTREPAAEPSTEPQPDERRSVVVPKRQQNRFVQTP